jgi:ribonuclease HI
LKNYFLNCDGGARGNPGPAGAGAILFSETGTPVAAKKCFLGQATNNIAEYQGLLLGLELVREHNCSAITIRLDSELVVRQILGQYKVKDQKLLPLWQKACTELAKIKKFSIQHIPREQNSEADRLVNQAIDQSLAGK